MAGKRKLTVEILGDATGVSRAFGQVESKAQNMSRKVGSAGKTAGLAIAGIGAAGVTAAIVLGPQVLEMGGKLEALGVKSATVFEGSQKDIQKWAKANAKNMGLTAKEAEGMAANMGDLLKPMGFTAKQAADMAIEMNDLSGALSAWSGGQRSAAEVSEILSKAMLGEREGLKSLGISISEAEVKARLLEKGQDGLTGAALQQAKALATQELILEKSTDAQTAWADGSMDAMKAQMSSEAAIKQVKESLVQALYPAMLAILPVVEKIAVWMGENLPVAMEVISAWVEENWPQIKEVIITAVTAIRNGIEGFITFVNDAWEQWGDEITAVVNAVWPPMQALIGATIETIRGIIKTVTALIRGDWDEVWNGIKQILSGVWDGIKATVGLAINTLKVAIRLGWDGIKATAKQLWGEIRDFIGDLWNTHLPNLITTGKDKIISIVKGLPGSIAAAVSGMFDGLWNSFKSVVNKIIDGWNGLEFTMPKINTRIPGIGTIGGFTVGTPNLPRLHSGGRVEAGGLQSFAGLATDEVAAILRRGETVLTQPQLAAVGGGGDTYVLEYRGVVPPDQSVMEQFRNMVMSIERERAGAL